MAIKISGTTVVSDARELQNIANVDVTTVDTLKAAGLGGSGLFNTAISSVTGYAINTSMATAFTTPATAGLTYVVHSIHITNIDDFVFANVSGQFSGITYPSITFADTVPVPVGSSVELLKKPKVLQPNDLIQLQSSTDGDLHATITIEPVPEIKLFGAGIDLTTEATYTTLYTATANSVIESILLSNDDSLGLLDVKASVVWTDAGDVIQGYFTFNIIVPNGATIEVLEQPKFIPNGFKVRVLANQANRLEAIIAGKTV
jgi:hypothetical protein